MTIDTEPIPVSMPSQKVISHIKATTVYRPLLRLPLPQIAFALCVFAAVTASLAQAVEHRIPLRTTVTNLAEPAFQPLPLGAVKPEGWLKRQLRVQADGLSGHLDEFWPDVGQSAWFGGKADSMERAQYWLDGVIPLAWGLGDTALQTKVKGYVAKIVASQRPDGWFECCPVDAGKKPGELWGHLLLNKALVQYHEASGDEAILQVVLRNLKAIKIRLDRKPLVGWGQFRWFEGLVPVFYAYEKTGEPWLLELARTLKAQGFDYMAFYDTEDVTLPTPRRGLWRMDKHGVNTGMALKAYPLAWRITGQENERAFPARMLDILDRYHGQVTGLFTCDETLSGKNPVQGTELCTVVETMYSLQLLLSLTGNAAYGDRLEKIAFNALPATFAPDMWSHQYNQQVNQVQCTINPDHQWANDGPEANLFGLQPNYGCCTANMHQGWPKFAAHLWMRTPEGGIAALAYAPSTACFSVKDTPVRVEWVTDYPFRETLKLRVSAEKPVRFPLVLRVPAWAVGATLSLTNGPAVPLQPGTMHRIEREWQGTVEADLRFPMKVQTSQRYYGAIAIERGPLVYVLKLSENWTRVNADKPHRELPHGDFEVRSATPWNYGLLIDESQPASSVAFAEQSVGEIPFSPEGAGVVARVKGRRLPGWKLANGWAAEIPPGPQSSQEPLEDLTLIPYGCAKLRVTEFPRLKQ